jgi:membrane protease YdiL (CAAX protease family)
MIAPMSRGSKIFLAIKEKKSLIEQKKNTDLPKGELKSMNDKTAFAGIIIYLMIYLALVIIDRLFIDLSNYYLIILSAYFIVFALIYVKNKKFDAKGLFKKKYPALIGAFLGLLIFIYHLIASSFFASTLGAKEYASDIPLFIISIAAISLSCEVFFREIIQAALKAKYSKHASILIQAALFAILAADIYNIKLGAISFAFISFLISFQIGILLGYARDEWGIASSIGASAFAGILSIIMIMF